MSSVCTNETEPDYLSALALRISGFTIIDIFFELNTVHKILCEDCMIYLSESVYSFINVQYSLEPIYGFLQN